MIFATPTIGDTEREAVARIDEIRRSLRFAIEGPKQWTGLLRRNLMARAIQGSNTIEGYNVTFDDAVAVMEGESIDVAEETRLALEGYRRALTYIINLADDAHYTFNEELIRGLHYMMIAHDSAKNPGRWRSGPVYVRRHPSGEVVYEGPAAESVPGLMRELVDAVRKPDEAVPPVVRAAMAHLNLVMVHPFSDGNGRMGRAIQTFVLARDGIVSPVFSSIEEYLGSRSNTDAYYRVLQNIGEGEWRPERDTRPWVHFCLRAHLQQAVTVQRRVRETEKLWDELEVDLTRRSLDHRMIVVLYEAAMGLRVKSQRYRTLADISAQVASRDFSALVREGLLTPRGERRGRTYVASPTLMQLRDKTREPRITEADIFTGNLKTLL